MWGKIASLIIRNRIAILIVLSSVTVFMTWQASQIELSYTFVKPLPGDDPAMIDYNAFKKMFGEDGNIMVIGLQDSNLFKLSTFNGLFNLSHDIKNISGIKEVLSVANIYNISKDDDLKKFEYKQLIKNQPTSQSQLDSLKTLIYSLPFYEGLIYNKETNATLIAITFDDKKLNSKDRLEIVENIKDLAHEFSVKHNVTLHFSGLPYIRTTFMKVVS